MERVFLLNHYPDVAARSELSNSTGLSEAQVQVSSYFHKAIADKFELKFIVYLTNQLFMTYV